MENLTFIDFMSQLINRQRSRNAGYDTATRWLCTNEEVQNECRELAMKMFEEWKEDEISALKVREKFITIKYVTL